MMNLLMLFIYALFTYITFVNAVTNRNKPTHLVHSKHIVDTNKISLLDKKHDLNSPNYQIYLRKLLKKAEHIRKMHLEILDTESAETVQSKLITDLQESAKEGIAQVILNCKQFMQDITKETDDVTSINLIYLFENVKKPYTFLKKVYEIANIQCSVLDKDMIQMMYNQHNTNNFSKRKTLVKHPNEKIVIIGADATEPIPFDVLICMEEPKQMIRNMYIGLPNQLSSTKDWVVAAWSKEKHTSKVLKAEYLEDWLEMKELEEFLDENNFDEVVENSKLVSSEVQNEFVGIVSKIILSQQTVRTHLVETKEKVYLAVELSEILAESLDKLVTKTRLNKEQAKKANEIKLNCKLIG
uniref:Uncharacterized protein n=1 Tax=Ditylenchus dipsaci TaxID=166011 RepID=A0A915EF05_9BILA